MNSAEYAAHDGLGLAGLIRAREASPLEVVDAAIERIEALNPRLNAVVHRAFDAARAAASAPLRDAPFAGVPFLVKDLGIGVAGWPRTSGSRFCKDVVDSADTGLSRRYRDAGVLLLGRAASSEFGILGNTETSLYGPTRNPWNPEHIAGGSSGGSAAAVAAGLVPLAHASDGLGSIRIPAACCGLVGVTPTRDRVPNLPDGFDYAMGFVVDHVVSRTVRDSATMLDATGIPEPGSPYAIPAKAGPYVDQVGRSPGRLRIAWSPETASGKPSTRRFRPRSKPPPQRCLPSATRCARRVSQRGSCLALDVDRSLVRYVSVKTDQAPLRLRIHNLARTRNRQQLNCRSLCK